MTGFDAVEAQQHIEAARERCGGWTNPGSWPSDVRLQNDLADQLVLAVAEVTRLEDRLDIENRNWLRRIEQDREFLTQVAASHGITEDQVTAAFLAKRAARFGSTEPESDPNEASYQAVCGSWDCRAPECRPKGI